MRISLHAFLVLLFTSSIVHGAILNPKIRWKFQSQGPVRGSAVTDQDKLYFGSSDGTLYALQKNSGELQWKFGTQGAITAAPLLVSNYVIIVSRDRYVYAVDAKSGQQVWKFQTQPMSDFPTELSWDYFSAAPVALGNNVLIGSADGFLYALNIRDGKLAWKFKTGGRIGAAPLVTSAAIYQPSHDGILYVLKPDGTLLWKYETEGTHFDSQKSGWDRNSIYTMPSLQDSLLVIGSRDGNVYCINVNSHKLKWKFTHGYSWCMSVSTNAVSAFIGWSDAEKICAVDLQTGKETWDYKIGSLVYTKPVLSGSDVIVGASDHKLYAFDHKNGSKRWEYELKGSVFSTAALDQDVVYIGDDSGSMYAIEEGVRPMTAVYYPIPKNEMFEKVFSADRKIMPFLKERGFMQLDSARLYEFLSGRIADKVPSVIVFAYDRVPSNIFGTSPDNSLVRKYLDAGGKIVWPGYIPNVHVFDEKGRMTGIDLGLASRVLDVSFIHPQESGNYYSKSTQAGLNWGLPVWSTITYAEIEHAGVTPLAIDEFNRPSAWMKKYNPRPGAAFVSCRTWGWYEPIQEEDLELLYRLAVHELE